MDTVFLKNLIQQNKVKTPSYILDCDQISAHVKKTTDITGNVVGQCYAMKANPFLTRHMSRLVPFIEVCSLGELHICEKYKIPPRQIVFSGVNKSKEDLIAAFRYGVHVITVESHKQWRLIASYCQENQCEVDVFLRLSDGMQFGMEKQTLEVLIKERTQFPHIHIKGIHYFSGTQKRNLQKNIEELSMMEEYLGYLKNKYEYVPEILEYGPGMRTPYFTNERFDTQYDGLKEIMAYIKEKKTEYKIILEMGRYYAASSGYYLTTVDDLKLVGDRGYCIVDGGIHHLNYYGQNMALRTPIILKIPERETIEKIDRTQNNRKELWTICGSLCTFADVLARDVKFDSLQPGDTIVFKNCGAYSMTESAGLFLSRSLPAVYIKENNQLVMVRDQTDTFALSC